MRQNSHSALSSRGNLCGALRSGKDLMKRQEEAAVSMKVRVREDHRISELRGTVGKVVGIHGGEELMVLEVHFPDGRYQLFWPGDLNAVASDAPWWRCLLGRRS
jgi:hypothetical protein